MKETTYATTVDNLATSRTIVQIHLPEDIMMMIDSKDEIREKKPEPLLQNQRKERKRLMLMELTNQRSAAVIVIPQNQTTMH